MRGTGRTGVALSVVAMAIGGIGVAVAEGATGTSGASGPVSGKRLVVKPGKGGPTTRFKVSFTTASPTGPSSGQIRTIALGVSGPSHPSAGCTDAVNEPVTVTKPGVKTVTLAAGSGSARWCRGTFNGSIRETIRPDCSAHMICPQYIALLAIGSFRFTVD